MLEMSKVSFVEEVDPGVFTPGRSSDVNDYLKLPEWILLNTGTHSTGVYYSVGWIGEGEPQFPSR